MSALRLQQPENCANDNEYATNVAGEQNHQDTNNEYNDEFVRLPEV